MKTACKLAKQSVLVLIFLLLNHTAGFAQKSFDSLKGAWKFNNGEMEEVLIFIDNYFTHSTYSLSRRLFEQTRGGAVQVEGGEIIASLEFNSKNKDEVGLRKKFSFSVKNNILSTNINGKKLQWQRIDDGSAPLAGAWRITDRQQEGKFVPIHQSGTRKTVKILSGTRFQWAAIDPGKKEFSGTGGGTYTFTNGKYTENIEFFSRDSSRVGAQLTFDGKLDEGKWHHSGLSSKGDKIYEVWGRVE